MKHMMLLKRLLIFILLVFSFSSGVSASSAWNNKISQLTNDIISVSSQKNTVYVSEVFDSSQDQIYLPFSNRIHASLSSSLIANGASVTNKYFDADFILTVNYTKSLEGLTLYASMTNKDGGKVSGGSILLASKILPENWNSRSLRNIAYEIAGKFDEKLLGQKINTVMSGLSGGESKSSDFISDFTVAMNEYMAEEFNALSSIAIKKDSRNSQNLYKIKGKFRVNGNKVSLSYKLLRKSDESIVAAASTEFTMDSIPQGMSMYPSNKNIAKNTFDDSSINSSNRIPVDLWVNHTNGVYKDDDRLEVSIRPNVDAYIRVFYVMSDGVICQIQPTSIGDTGLLAAGVTHTIGSKDDDVELIITDDTIGQEVIKVFASLSPIEERFLPTKYIEGVDYACTDNGYKSLKSGMTRGLKMKRSIHPVNEIKILVK
jgi:hypothetical protein